jgi:hypothetical protein
MNKGPIAILAALFAATYFAQGESPRENTSDSAESGAFLVAVAPQPDKAAARDDPCADPGLQPNSMPPTWNIQAVPEQCGALETDNLAVLQPMRAGAAQWTMATTAKYGLTPRLQLRWGLPGRIWQHASGTRPVSGTTDQMTGVLYHFHDQTAWLPDLALDYGFKIPTANPSKAFGSGYGDHVLTFVASRDAGPYHVDFNLAGTIAGCRGGRDGAAQSGLGLSRSFAHNLMGTIEAFGGSQPGTRDRLGAAFAGGSWGMKPWLALNGGSIRSYTAGSQRSQFMLGFIYTMRPGLRLGRKRGWL